MEQLLEWPTLDNIFSTAQPSPKEADIALMEMSFQEFKEHTLPIFVHLFFLKKGGLKFLWSTPFYLSENYFVRAKLYLRPETPEDKMKESSSSEVEVADWIDLTRSSVSTEHSKTNFWMLCKPPNQRLQEHHRHSAVLNHCENY